MATNDRNKSFAGDSLAALCVEALPPLGLSDEVAQTVGLIDVLWISPNGPDVVCAFEVEKSTSIYSGILRLLDLSQSLNDRSIHFYLVAPDNREKEIQAQLRRPAFGSLSGLEFRYLLF